MTDRQRADALLDRFGTLLPSAPRLGYPPSEQAAADDAFELLVLALLLRAAVDLGMGLVWRSRAGQLHPSHLRFLRGPGNVWGGDDITHAIILRRPCRSLEAHVGVKIDGVSGCEHEADVLLLDAFEGWRSRRRRRNPRAARVRALAECKLHSRGLDLGHARGLLGLWRDMGEPRWMFLCSNLVSSSVDGLLSFWLPSGGFHGGLPDDGTHNDAANELMEAFQYALLDL